MRESPSSKTVHMIDSRRIVRPPSSSHVSVTAVESASSIFSIIPEFTSILSIVEGRQEDIQGRLRELTVSGRLAMTFE